MAFRIEGFQSSGDEGHRVVRLRVIIHEKEIKFKLSGNEVYYTNYLILPVKNML